MLTAADRAEAPTAIQTNLAAIFVSLELSRTIWLVTSLSPGGGEKMSKHSLQAGDIASLLARFQGLKEKALTRTGKPFPIVAIQEAGLDGFWLHRVLQSEGIESHVQSLATAPTMSSSPTVREVHAKRVKIPLVWDGTVRFHQKTPMKSAWHWRC